jgi:DNA-directed RNA polymerase alpha subunit
MDFLFQHLAGCMPAIPCENCVATRGFLRTSPHMFKEAVDEKRAELSQKPKLKVNLKSKLSEIPGSNILSIRTRNVVFNNGVRTLADLLRYSPNGILEMDYAGRRTLNEIEKFVLSIGCKLTEDT